MFLIDLLLALLVALIIAVIFSMALPGRGAGVGGLFFIVILLATWAGAVWIRPFGPPVFGIYWMPFALVGLLVALLAAAFSWGGPGGGRTEEHSPEEREAEADAETVGAMGAMVGLLWVILIISALALAARYLFAL